MSSSITEMNLAGEYSCSLKDKFIELGKRLFIVDYSKSSAAKSLSKLLTEEKFDSFLIIVENAEVAEAFKKTLSSVLGEIHIIDSVAKINSALKDSAKTASALDSYAKTFKENYKNLIITRTDKNELIFNRVIGEDTTRNGTFSGDNTGAYRLSDMLGESAYDFVCVDDIYKQITFEEPAKDKTFSPGKYEEFDFLGKNYYVNSDHSLKKLKCITSRAKGCVIISDVVADTDAVELFWAIDLLTTSFSHYDTKDKVKPVTQSFYSGGEDGYSGACDVIYGAITNGRAEDSILSMCLQRTKGSKQTIPGDLNSMGEYLVRKTEFMSFEEVFLQVMSSQMKNRFKNSTPSVDAVIDNLSENFEDMATCFIDMFFSNSIKGELESLLSTPRIFEMSGAELAGVYSVFSKYGAYHYLGDNDKVKFVRIKRDDSAFEYFVRRYFKNDIEDSLCYSVMGDGSDDVYKCLQLRRLCEGRESLGFEAPVIVVVNSRFDAIFDKVKKTLTDFKVEKSLDALYSANAGDSTVVVVDFDDFRASAHDIRVGSVVFLDLSPEFVEMKLMLAKACKLSSGSVFAFATYGDVSGILLDAWQDDFEVADKALPFTCNEQILKFSERHTYAEVVERINTVYTLLSQIVTFSRSDTIEKIADDIKNINTDLGNAETFTNSILLFDIEYASRIGKCFNDVFRNTSSVGSDGDSVFAIPKEYNSKATNGLSEASDTKNCMFFNVCAKMLRRVCDLSCNDCADCADYKKFLKNDFTVLETSVEKYLQLCKRYVKELADLKYKLMVDDIIFTESNDEESKALNLDDISSNEFILKGALDSIKSQGGGKEFIFHSDYKDVLGIREAVYQLYRKILRKYFKSVMLVYKASTEMAKKGILSCREALAASEEA